VQPLAPLAVVVARCRDGGHVEEKRREEPATTVTIPAAMAM
jgi:hypothetical protein